MFEGNLSPSCRNECPLYFAHVDNPRICSPTVLVEHVCAGNLLKGPPKFFISSLVERKLSIESLYRSGQLYR